MPLSKEQEERKVPAKHRRKRDERREDQNDRMEQLIDKMEEISTKGHMKDIAYHFTNKKEVVKVNFLAGVARGVGLTIGTAIFIGLLIAILTWSQAIPFLGEYLAEFLDMIQENRTTETET
ncbi:DUF5665 domain-containing protein [Alteribacter natronophilus]|uniref:DUF5665 domain-containing protein n=1 Tax=Alteribacter natronophilus TaxID=2583810 RepID=UPI00110D9EEA|nr:DUF5665 domain-containing protein [Alteribacter natronophilus]TMW71136.1 hypothetical protein FGB90_14325 [Alteribacter natronophilus]